MVFLPGFLLHIAHVDPCVCTYFPSVGICKIMFLFCPDTVLAIGSAQNPGFKTTVLRAWLDKLLLRGLRAGCGLCLERPPSRSCTHSSFHLWGLYSEVTSEGASALIPVYPATSLPSPHVRTPSPSSPVLSEALTPSHIEYILLIHLCIVNLPPLECEIHEGKDMCLEQCFAPRKY